MNYSRAYLLLTLTTIVLQGNLNASGSPKSQRKIPPPQCAQLSAHHICQQLGVPLTLRQVCEMMPAKDSGESMLEIKRFLENAGLECEGAKIKLSHLYNEQLPVIAHMITKIKEETLLPHWVVVQKVDKRQIDLLDGLGYQAVLSYDNFAKEWDGRILRVTKPKNARRPSFVARTKPANSWIQFEKLYINAGDIPQSEKGHRFVFPFLNIGKEDLRILKIQPDCKCTVAEDGERVIPPGGRGEIMIRFTFGDHRGRFHKSALVKSNDPYFPFVKLSMVGNGRQDVKIRPARLDFGNIPQAKSSKATCFLTYKGVSLFEVGGAESPFSEMTINTEPLSPELLKRLNPDIGWVLMNECQNRYMLSAEICTEGMGLGPRNYTVEVPTNLVSAPRLTIPVSFNVVSPIRITPSRLFLGELHEKSSVRKKIELKSETGEDFFIESVDVGKTGLACNCSQKVSGALHTLQFSGVVKDRDQLHASIQICVRIGGSQALKQLEIPVSGLILAAKENR